MKVEIKRATDYRGLSAFLAIAYLGAWLLALPMWLSGQGLQYALAPLLLPAIMYTPALATFVVTQWIRPQQDRFRTTGLWFGARGSKWWRYWVFCWLAIPGFVIAAPFVGSLFGVYPLDIANFSGYREQLESTPGGAQSLKMLSLHTLLIVQFLGLLVSPVLNAVFAIGEEWGWRGYLLPHLLPLGQWPALILSGAIWGLWHAPIILLGYNYPSHPQLGVLLMICTSTIIGVILGWTRLATGSIWSAVIGHGALNGSAGIILLVRRAGTTVDSAQAGITGWTGWILPLMFILFLAAMRWLPVNDPPDRKWTR